MSLGKNQSFFELYGKNSYMGKINPEFEGIAKKYYNQKREHEKVHTIKTKLDKDIAYIERMEKNIQQALSKKKRELQYTKQVNHRLHIDLQRREWLQQLQRHSVQNNHEKARLRKVQSERKLKEAKIFLSEHKRSLAEINRSENQKIKEVKTIKRAQEWDTNRSRVSQISQFQKNVKQKTYKFYQTKNQTSMSKYQQRIRSYKQFQEYDADKIKKLEELKLSLSEKYQKDKKQCDDLAKEIERLKKESKLENSLVRSRLKSSQSSLSARSSRGLRNIKHHSQYLGPDHP